MSKILRVGFDLDGVLLYNPIRTFRPIAAFLKPYILKKSTNNFYFPRTKIEQIFWRLLHLTSFCIAPGVTEIGKLVEQKKIKAYIITSRYSFLSQEFFWWMKKFNANKYFSGYYYNKNNKQPNEFKKDMIKKLKLDIFVEDNFGVIQKLNGDIKKIKVFWITNWFDMKIKYQYKFGSLKEVIQYISS